MLRLGTVPYLNALPLIDGLADAPGVSLELDVPSRLLPRLRGGDLDVALVSAVELFRAPPLGWVPGPAITSRGPVRSILLYLRTNPEAIRSVALDTSSLSAAAMTRICLECFLRLPSPVLLPAPPDAALDALDADAVLRIGDPALRTDAAGRRVIDLGALWTEHTGLPFVYALWLTHPELETRDLAPTLLAARDRGLACRDALADGFAATHGMDAGLCRDYLRTSIGYELGGEELAGLRRFGRLAHELGLVDTPSLPPAAG